MSDERPWFTQLAEHHQQHVDGLRSERDTAIRERDEARSLLETTEREWRKVEAERDEAREHNRGNAGLAARKVGELTALLSRLSALVERWKGRAVLMATEDAADELRRAIEGKTE